MAFTITEVFTQDGHLVVKADHFRPDGSAWFTENYTWQGREGLKQKRATNALGQLLLDDGTVAPSTVRRGPPDEVEYILPPGRQWARRSGTHMVDDSILSVIRTTHRQRSTTAYPSRIDQLRTPVGAGLAPPPADVAGCPALLAKFQTLIGWTE